MSFDFTLETTSGAARAARFDTPHGVVETPAFMAVGTLATVKALDPHDLRAMHAQMILAEPDQAEPLAALFSRPAEG